MAKNNTEPTFEIGIVNSKLKELTGIFVKRIPNLDNPFILKTTNPVIHSFTQNYKYNELTKLLLEYIEALRNKKSGKIAKALFSNYEAVYKKMKQQILSFKIKVNDDLASKIVKEYKFLNSLIALSNSYINNPKAKDENRKASLRKFIDLLSQMSGYIKTYSKNLAANGLEYFGDEYDKYIKSYKFDELKKCFSIFLSAYDKARENSYQNIEALKNFQDKAQDFCDMSEKFNSNGFETALTVLQSNTRFIVLSISNLKEELKPDKTTVEALESSLDIISDTLNLEKLILNKEYINMYKNITTPLMAAQSKDKLSKILAGTLDPMEVSIFEKTIIVVEIKDYLNDMAKKAKKNQLTSAEKIQFRRLEEIRHKLEQAINIYERNEARVLDEVRQKAQELRATSPDTLSSSSSRKSRPPRH